MSRRGSISKYIIIGIVSLILPIAVGFGVLFSVLSQRSQIHKIDPRIRHYVSNRMISETERMATKPAPLFELKDPEGATHSLKEMIKEAPVLVYFINHECPCSVDAEPMFNAFASAYRQVKVVGIIDGDVALAKTWIKENKPNHLILIDSKSKTMQAYKAESSVYTALVTQSGKIVKMWPGYSQAMMEEVSKAMADLVGAPVVQLDKKLAPDEMAAGCAFKFTVH